MKSAPMAFEWPTFGLTVLTYVLWGLALFLPVGLAIVVLSLLAALHASLTHEALHGHPSRSSLFNAIMVFPALSLLVPYLRFRDTHLAHHRDPRLTDPYEDPESNFLDPAVWAGLPDLQKTILRAHNTLAGRMVLGPVVGQIRFMSADWHAIRRGEFDVLAGWLLHIPAVGLVLGLVWLSPLPIWAYLIAAYLANAVLRIRTFLEHRAHEEARGRTVIIEDRGLLAWLFLNNNLHVVHHLHPRLPWYALPRAYAEDAPRYLAHNDGYRFASYREIFARYFFRSKDPVPHPLYED